MRTPICLCRVSNFSMLLAAPRHHPPPSPPHLTPPSHIPPPPPSHPVSATALMYDRPWTPGRKPVYFSNTIWFLRTIYEFGAGHTLACPPALRGRNKSRASCMWPPNICLLNSSENNGGERGMGEAGEGSGDGEVVVVVVVVVGGGWGWGC